MSQVLQSVLVVKDANVYSSNYLEPWADISLSYYSQSLGSIHGYIALGIILVFACDLWW